MCSELLQVQSIPTHDKGGAACVCGQWVWSDSMVARAAGGAGESRMRSYKTRGLDLEEVRRRKEEEGLQLRKSKREEQVSYSDMITSVQEDLDT